MPTARKAMLERLAGGADPATRSLGAGKAAAAVLADVPFSALVEEVARRTRSGQVREVGADGI